MAAVARLYQGMRDAERHAVMIDGTLRNARAEPQDVVIDDLSATGFRTKFASGLAVGDVVTLGLYGAGLRSARVMRESEGRFACQFFVALTGNELAFALAGLATPEPIPFSASDPLPTNTVCETLHETGRSATSRPSLSPRSRILILTCVAIGPWLAIGTFWMVR